MRFKTWDKVPDHIKNKYFYVDATILDGFEGVDRAASIYWDRQAPTQILSGKAGLTTYRIRYTRPMGHYSKYGTWYPDPKEVQECCKKIKSPPSYSKWPWAYKSHCNTITHVALLCGVEPIELRRRVLKDLEDPNVQIAPRNRTQCIECNKFALYNDIYCQDHRWVEDVWNSE